MIRTRCPSCDEPLGDEQGSCDACGWAPSQTAWRLVDKAAPIELPRTPAGWARLAIGLGAFVAVLVAIILVATAR